jgi:hypothetical protein
MKQTPARRCTAGLWVAERGTRKLVAALPPGEVSHDGSQPPPLPTEGAKRPHKTNGGLMTETEIQHTTEPATEAATEPVTESAAAPVTEPGSGRIVNALHEEQDRLEHAKSSLIHAVESAVGKFTDTLGITGGRK